MARPHAPFTSGIQSYGVSSALFVISKLPPCARRYNAIRVFSFLHAIWLQANKRFQCDHKSFNAIDITYSAVSPLIFCAFILHPLCRRTITVSTLPDNVAQCNALLFSSSQIFGSAPQFNRAVTIL